MKANIVTSEESVKDEHISEEAMQMKNCTFKKLSDILHSIESTKDKISEADPNLGVR